MNPQGARPVTDQQFNRACDACRMHKVRCLPNNSASSKSCQRCARTDRQCVYTAPQKKKQRKRTDTRVAELEREVQAMRALFDKKQEMIPEETSVSPPHMLTPAVSSMVGEVKPDPQIDPTMAGQNILLDWAPTYSSGPDSQDTSPPPFSPDSDVVDRGIISLDFARELYHDFVTLLMNHYPAVQFASNLTADEVRASKPTLFLAVIAAASGIRGSQLYGVLNTEVLSAYAYGMVMNGEKSLELVQALTVSSIWYFPPGSFTKLKFYEYIHMAATMAIDIGLGKHPKIGRTRRALDEHHSPTTYNVDAEEMERRKTFLTCWLTTTGVSMSMRRPNMLRFNNWLGECLETVASIPNPTKYDKYLVSWVKLSRITEEIGSSFSFDDPDSAPSLSEALVQVKVNSFEKLLEAWRRERDPDSINDTIMIQYYHTQLYLHEIALYDDHPPEDFVPPFGLKDIISIHIDPRASSSFIDSTAVSITSAQALLDILLNMDIETLRALPIFNFVRMAYAFITLVKLYISSKSPESKIGSVLNPSSIKLRFYLDSFIQKLTEASGPQECRAPNTFIGMLNRCKTWYESQESTEVFTMPVISPPAGQGGWMAAVTPPTHGSASQTDIEHTAINATGDVGMAGMALATDGMQYTEQDINDLLHYDGMNNYDPTFNNWIPGVGMQGPLDNVQVSEMYGWDMHGSRNT